MPIILYMQLVLGNLFVVRTLAVLRKRSLISTSAVTKTGILYVSATSCVVLFGERRAVFCLSMIVVLMVSTLISLLVWEKHQLNRLKGEFPLFLDRWILNLRLGLALSSARERALQHHSHRFQLFLQPLFATQDRPAKGFRRHQLLDDHVVADLERMAQEPHCALARLECLRELLRKTDDFRRKSGQATRQTCVQCVVLIALLIALGIFTVRRYGFTQSFDFIAASALLSSAGMIAMVLLAKKRKWKV